MKTKLKLISLPVLACTAGYAYLGYACGWGPFQRLHNIKTSGYPGNAAKYAPCRIKKAENSPLYGKHLIFLGSSVTYGAKSMGVSFADYIAARNGCTITKEAVSGTTLANTWIDSYVSRLKRIKDKQADLFVCQLSTNDVMQKKPLGEVSESFSRDMFKTSAVAGAIEYIISYAKETWNCPVVFYTNPRYDSDDYAAMVRLLEKIAEKWDITIIDFWNDAAFNELNAEQRLLYMADAIHPTRAGYLEWWTPEMESILFDLI